MTRLHFAHLRKVHSAAERLQCLQWLDCHLETAPHPCCTPIRVQGRQDTFHVPPQVVPRNQKDFCERLLLLNLDKLQLAPGGCHL